MTEDKTANIITLAENIDLSWRRLEYLGMCNRKELSPTELVKLDIDFEAELHKFNMLKVSYYEMLNKNKNLKPI